MSNFKQASKIGLRIQTSKGPLSVEQLWTLRTSDLVSAIKALKKKMEVDKGDDLDFLTETVRTNPVDQLSFDILKEIYLDKKAEEEASRRASEDKKHNEKIFELIAKKQESDLENKSIDELKAMIR